MELTVCVPAFNAGSEIERAIRSIRVDEIAGGVEILVCDDRSTDDTWQVLERLSREVPQIRLLRNDRNRGRPFTRNRLLNEATGRFLAWLDADDEKYSGMLEAQLDHLRLVETDRGSDALSGLLVYTNYDWLRVGWDRPKLMAPQQPDDPMKSLLDSSFGGYLWLMMGLRTTFLAAAPFDERLPRLQDLGFFIRFAELGGRFERVEAEEPLCVYHKDDSGRGALEVWRSWNYIWRRYRHHFTSYGLVNARRWRRHHFRVARRYAKANSDSRAYVWIVFLEVVYVITGRFRRVVFDA
jgi:glycosyltransferase involved in cell wall biosynthesis